MRKELDSLINAPPPLGAALREWWEEVVAEELLWSGIERHRGWSAKSIIRVRVLPGRQREARLWIQDVLGASWPAKRVERELGRLVESVYNQGDVPPEHLFDVRIEWRLKKRGQLAARPNPDYQS